MTQVKRLIEIVCAVTYAILSILAASQGMAGIQFASGFAVLAIAFGVPYKIWITTWRHFGGLFRWLLMLVGIFAVSV
jgi:hypothetical protein